MEKSALIILANGFEEIEAVAVIDILRRAGVAVTVAGLDQKLISSSRQIRIEADVELVQLETRLFDAVILPGGEPGTTHLQESALVVSVLHRHKKADKWICAICAAPRILNQLGLLHGKKATSFPGTQPKMTDCIYLEDDVVVESDVITSRGAGTALAFGYAIAEVLTSRELVLKLKDAMVFH